MKTKKQLDTNTSIKELKDMVRKFCEKRDWDQYHNAKDLTIALSIEVAELLEIFRWKNEEEIRRIFEDEEKLKMIKDELADVLYFVLRIAQMNNIDLSSSLKEKIIKNEQKYPVDKFKGLNKKYNEVD